MTCVVSTVPFLFILSNKLYTCFRVSAMMVVCPKLAKMRTLTPSHYCRRASIVLPPPLYHPPSQYTATTLLTALKQPRSRALVFSSQTSAAVVQHQLLLLLSMKRTLYNTRHRNSRNRLLYRNASPHCQGELCSV